MTPLSLHELETEAFRRALAAALGVPDRGEPPWPVERRSPAAWDPLGSVEPEDRPRADAAPERKAA
jgi:hypothetical protein